MHITFVDTQSNITSNVLNLKAIDSTQKKIILFAESLVKRSHKVTIVNNNSHNEQNNGILWKNYKNTDSFSADILIFLQNPKILYKKNFLAKKKILWMTSNYPTYSYKELLITLIKQRCSIIYDNHSLIDDLPHNFRLVPKYFLGNAVDKRFYEITPQNFTKSNALVTSHPLRGLDWLIDVWSKFIHNKLPWAELHIYSELLSREGLSDNIKINNLKLRLYALKNFGIFIIKPISLKFFLKELPKYRVHLNPSIDNNTSVLTLLESQAAGIPIVSRASDIIYNSIFDNETGYITNDAEKFSTKAVALLSDKTLFNRISRNSKLNTNIKTWQEISSNFERHFT